MRMRFSVHLRYSAKPLDSLEETDGVISHHDLGVYRMGFKNTKSVQELNLNLSNHRLKTTPKFSDNVNCIHQLRAIRHLLAQIP